MPTPPRLLTHGEHTRPIEEWARLSGVPISTIRSRLDKLGWDLARALATPADRRFRRGGRPKADTLRPVPKLRQHPESGQAFARWRMLSRDHCRYFGRWGSDEAKQAYRRFAAEWAAGSFEAVPPAGGRIGVAAMLRGWLAWCAGEYRRDGVPTSETHVCRSAARAVNVLYGSTVAADFGPAALRAVRKVWINEGKARKTVNEYTARIVRAFGWAVGQSLISPAVHQSLIQVEPVKPGRGARETPKRTGAELEAIAAALAKLPAGPRSEVIRAAVGVQRLTGMRPGETCALRACDLDTDTADGVWVYEVRREAIKGLHLGETRRRYYFGPLAQGLLAPLLTGADPDAPVFAYKRGEKRHRLTVAGYSLAVRKACQRAACEPWTPHQLRHALATEVAERTGSLAQAAAAIGDTPATAARHYVHVDPRERARREIAREHG